MKGAAASFGIVTEFVVHTQPAPQNVIQYSYRLQYETPFISSRRVISDS
jgi:hypothetical protein